MEIDDTGIEEETDENEKVEEVESEDDAAEGGDGDGDGDGDDDAGGDGDYLTLADIGRETGIPYVTLARYSRSHGARIPSVGDGRERRYPRAAIAVFLKIKGEKKGRRGRPPNNNSTTNAAGSDSDTVKGKAREVGRRNGRRKANRQSKEEKDFPTTSPATLTAAERKRQLTAAERKRQLARVAAARSANPPSPLSSPGSPGAAFRYAELTVRLSTLESIFGLIEQERDSIQQALREL